MLLLMGLSIVQAQDKQNKQPDPGKLQPQEQFKAVIPEDPKLISEQKARSQTHETVNPSQSPTMETDPKLTTKEFPSVKDYGESNTKPMSTKSDDDIRKEIAERDSRALQIANEKPVVTSSPPLSPDNNKQPPGETVKGTLNVRNIQAPDDQPLPVNKVKVTSYRDYKGSDEQPKGTKPGK